MAAQGKFAPPAVRTLAGAAIPVTQAQPGQTVQQLRAHIAPHFGCSAGCRLFLNVSCTNMHVRQRRSCMHHAGGSKVLQRPQYPVPLRHDCAKKSFRFAAACVQGVKLPDKRTLASLDLQPGQFLVSSAPLLPCFQI